DAADYVADGTDDQTEINAALTAATGGKVYLTEGTFTISGSVILPGDTMLTGAGPTSIIKIKNSVGSNFDALRNATHGSGSISGITLS
ncbi:glycosyl hydrolase family 28-related protein, partial [Francisella tularensis]|uniref:glycosyl hydrolase family 28-related protein n=1 Tax=Francisella tularensis TaxID=263 RepID=UPI0023819408